MSEHFMTLQSKELRITLWSFFFVKLTVSYKIETTWILEALNIERELDGSYSSIKTFVTNGSMKKLHLFSKSDWEERNSINKKINANKRKMLKTFTYSQ